MKYDLLLFDMDGTLIDSEEGIINSIMYALECFGIKGKCDRELIGMGIRNIFHSFGSFSEERVEEMVVAYREYLVDKGLFEAKLYGGIVDLLETLRNSGVKMAVATAKATMYAKIALEHFGIAHYFDLIMGSELDGRRTEKDKIIAAVFGELDPARAMKVAMIGDRKYDILGAKAHGIDSYGCLWGYSVNGELEQAGVDFLAATPKQLLEKFL